MPFVGLGLAACPQVEANSTGHGGIEVEMKSFFSAYLASRSMAWRHEIEIRFEKGFVALINLPSRKRNIGGKEHGGLQLIARFSNLGGEIDVRLSPTLWAKAV